jgi:hypothetical protein
MSYEISYRRQAFMLTAVQAGHYDDLYFLVEEAGSNNCYELDNRRRSRSWFCLATGALWECLAEVTRCAASCCSGSLVLYGRRRIKPEAYIRAWRKMIAAAVPLDEAHRKGFSVHLFTRVTDEDAKDGRKHAFDCLAKQTLVQPRQGKDEFTGREYTEWRFNAAVPEQVKLWLETKVTGRGFHSVEVHGPCR